MYNRKIAAFVMILMILAAVVFGTMGRPIEQSELVFVTDGADILSPAEEEAILAAAESLLAETNVGFYVATVENTGNHSTGDYARELCDRWGLTNYDMMLLLSEGDDDYYFLFGNAIGQGTNLSENYRHYLDNWLEPDFARGEYGQAVLAFMERVTERVTSGIPENRPVEGLSAGSFVTRGMWAIFKSLAVVVIFVGVCLLIAVMPSRSRRRRRISRMPGEPRRMEPGPIVMRAPMNRWETGGRVNDWHMPSHKEKSTGTRSGDFGGITATTVSRTRRTSGVRKNSGKTTFSGGGRSSVTRTGGGRSGASRSGGGRR